MKPFGAEMKNPVIPVDSRERSVRPILGYRFDTFIYRDSERSTFSTRFCLSEAVDRDLGQLSS